MGIDPKLIDQLLVGYKKPEEIAGENGLLKQLTKAVIERALQAELTGHLGYERTRSSRVQDRELAQRQEPEKAEGRFR